MKNEQEFNALFEQMMPKRTTKSVVAEMALTVLIGGANMFLTGLVFGLGFKLAERFL